jgi:cyclophilin family peptidyl-prolyl cis-trans isomerase
MKPRPFLAVALACLAALATTSPVAAYTPPETNPRIVVTTSQGQILIALAPESAPQHVEQFLQAVAAGDFSNAYVLRASPNFYLQLVGKASSARLAGQPVERLKIGNIKGALSLYDAGVPGEAPTLSLFLTDSSQLDSSYTSIGVLEAGAAVAEKLAATPTAADQRPLKPLTIQEIHIATPEERTLLRQAEKAANAPDSSTSLLAAIFIIAAAAFVAAMISAFHDRLSKQQMSSLALVVVLLAFFAIWVGLAGTDHGSGLVGVALFGGAIAIFRLMGRFERPAQAALVPVSTPDETPTEATSPSP